jgi:hypothetical protein
MTISYELKNGSHESREAGMCAMEWVAYIAGEEHTDSPVCVDVALRRFSIGLNDALPDDLRQQLRPYLARMVGTANDGLQQKRLFMLADWAVHVPAVEALEATGRRDLADSLRAVPPVVDVKSARAAVADAAAVAAAPARQAMWERLLPSALDLLDRMLPTETVEIPEPYRGDLERLLEVG